ncbi:MAG: dicarboxylate transporter subunit DctP, partial [Chloroflexi bacterium]|nr:dicarboxylate transporter subunit DctP [Chloroflexota bacterium]
MRKYLFLNLLLTLILFAAMTPFRILADSDDWTTRNSGTTQDIRWSSGSSNPIVFGPGSDGTILHYAGLDRLAISLQPASNLSVDNPFSTQPVIAAYDVGGNPLAGVTIAASVEPGTGTGTLTGTTALITDASGGAAFSGLGYTKTDAFKIRFTADDKFCTSDEIGPLLTGAASLITIATAPATAAEASADDNLVVQPVIRIADRYDNPVQGAAVTASGISNSVASYSLTVKVLGQGATSPAPGIYQKSRNGSVSLVATPKAGWKFSGWVGSISGTSRAISFAMTQNRVITAVFEPIDINDKITYSVEHLPESYIYLYGHQPFADAIKEATNESIEITIYPGASLLPISQNWEGVKSDVADLGWISTAAYPGKFSLAEVSTLPFMFPNATVGSKVSWEIFNKYPEIRSQWQENKVLTTLTSDPYFIVSAREFYTKIEDLKYKKIRAFSHQSYDLINALGGSSVMVSISECYLALEKGVIDGMLINADDYVNMSMYEVAPYITYLPTMCDYHAIVMNLATWNSYSQTIRNQIMSAAGGAASNLFGSGAFDKAREDLVARIEARGGTVYEYTPVASEQQRM